MKSFFYKPVFFFLWFPFLFAAPAEAQLNTAARAVIAGSVIGGLLRTKPKSATQNQPNQNANRKDTAAVLNFNTMPAAQFAASDIADISGVWEGEQSNGNLIMYYKVALNHLSGNTYSGYDYCVWEKNIDHSPINTNNGAMPNAKKSFLGTFSNAGISFTEIATLENSKWGLVSEKFKVVDDNGTPAIINDNNQPQRKVYLKRTSTAFPDEELKYVINENSFQIINPAYRNSANETVFKYSDHGQLTLAVKNTSDIDFNGITGQVTTTESENGILDYDKLLSTFSLPKNTTDALPLTINMNTNFAVPAGKVHFNIVFTYNGFTLAHQTLEVPAKSFYKTDAVTLPAYTSPRMKAVAEYFGFSDAGYGDAAKSLEPMVAADKMAAMWKAAFLYMGRGQYRHDEAEAYNIGKTSIATVEEKARNGDAEALYLLWYACQMGLEGEAAETLGNAFLQKSSDAGFMPAVYDDALQAYQQKNYTPAYQQLEKLSAGGLKKADNIIGIMYEQGYGVNKDDNTAIEWYKKGLAFGDPDAMLSLANIYAAGFEDTQPDVTKAISFATEAAAKNSTEAMVFLGRKYADGNQGVAKNITAAMKWLNEASELGDRKAMLAMGAVYLSDEPGLVKDEHKGIFWIKKAAESGSPKAMNFLWQCYQNGEYIDKDEITARYWHNQAAIAGYAQADATGINAAAQTFSDFWNNADFSPSYVYINEYHEVDGDSGDGLFNGLITGMFGAMRNYYGNQQQLIDGLEYIYKKNGNKIYGGTVSSLLTSNLYLRQGETVDIKAYGTVSTGMMSGLASADGLGNSWQEYAFVKGIPCSAVMAEVKDGSWQFIGQKNSFTATKDGPLMLALNGIDYQNYKGYFDLVVQVPDN